VRCNIVFYSYPLHGTPGIARLALRKADTMTATALAGVVCIKFPDLSRQT